MSTEEQPGQEPVVRVHASRLPSGTPGDEDWELLSAEERARADAFKFPHHRHRYVAAHARLRRQLGAYAGSAPEGLCIRVGAFGKPHLQGSPWEFNLSHSDDDYAAAFCRGASVGIDVETGGHLPADESHLVDHVCHPEERERWRREEDAAQRRCLFLCYWTGKEACLKAIGCGLQIAPGKVRLEGDPRKGSAVAIVESTLPDGGDPNPSWELQFLDVSASRVLAVATRPHWRVERAESPFDA